MPGTKRTIVYLESKFETGDIPTETDFQDLFASFIHYQQLAQTTGSDTEIPMSQDAVTDALAALGGGVVVHITYADIAAMLADQANQDVGKWYMATDASADATVDAGWAIYQKLAPSTANLTDYQKIAEQESLDIIVTNASETVKGIVEEATDTEMQAGTASGGTGAKLFSTPAKLATWWTWLKTQAQTFAAQITFTLAPRFSSTTASQFLKVDSNKDLTSVGSASQSDMVTGTDDTKPATALSVESKVSVKLVTFSNSASGTQTIDCGNKQALAVEFTTTVTGDITIAFSNALNLEHIDIFIPITGANKGITFPSGTKMSRYNEVSSGDGWYEATPKLQVSSTGTADIHEFSLRKRGVSSGHYSLRYDGPQRA